MKYFISLLIFSNILFSQNKTIVPKSGTIVFIKEEKVLDKDLYLKSYKELMPKIKKAMEQQIYLERLTDGKKTDTIQLKKETEKSAQNFEMMLPFIIEEGTEVIKFHHEFNGDTIKKYNTINGEYRNEKTINQISGIITNEFNEHVEIKEDEIIKLTEFKIETKLINGFNCYKVVCIYNESQKDDFDFLSNITTNIRELWVTEEINCKYHPVINEKEILEKYYPLEIREYSNEIKGFETNYKLDLITFKP